MAVRALPSIKLPSLAGGGALISSLKDAPLPRVVERPTAGPAFRAETAAIPAPTVQPEGSIIKPAIVLPSQAPVVPGPAPLVRLPAAAPVPYHPPVALRPQTPPARTVQQPVVQRAAPATSSPIAAINAFYAYDTQHNFSAAASTWSSHMRAEYPPPVYINDRFAATSYIGLQSARVLYQDGSTATVSVYVVEIYAGKTRHWAGTWQLVRSGNSWLLNQPNLRAA